MTETTNSARDQPNPKVDITPETIYNLIKLVEQNAPLLALLENHKPGPQDALKSEPKGASDMAKRHKQRVRIGTDEKGAAIYKWADGHTVEELNDNIVRLYIEHGLLRKFLDSHPNIVILDSKSKKDCPTFREYANQWYKKYKEQKLRTTSDSGYKSAFRLHLFPFFGDKRLDEITTDYIQEFLNAKADLSYSTVHSMLILFKQIMASAFEDRFIPFDPAVSKRITIPSTGKKTRDALTPEQAENFASAEVLVLMLIGAFLGYFAAEMLLQKTVKVFKGRWKGFLAVAAALILFVCCAEFDVFGFERRVAFDEAERSAEIVKDRIKFFFHSVPLSFQRREDIQQL